MNIDYNQFFYKATSLITRGHNLKLFKPRSYLELRRNFFSERIIMTPCHLSHQLCQHPCHVSHCPCYHLCHLSHQLCPTVAINVTQGTHQQPHRLDHPYLLVCHLYYQHSNHHQQSINHHVHHQLNYYTLHLCYHLLCHQYHIHHHCHLQHLMLQSVNHLLAKP